jgi:hypothetical protein
MSIIEMFGKDNILVYDVWLRFILKVARFFIGSLDP